MASVAVTVLQRFSAGNTVPVDKLNGQVSGVLPMKSFVSDRLNSPFTLQIRNLNYSITVSTNEENPGIFRVTREELKRSWETIYTSHPTIGDPVRLQDDDTHLLLRMAKTGEQRKYGHRIMVRPNQPALTQIREHQRVVRSHKGLVEQIINVIANMRFLDLVPDRMRQGAFPGQTVLGDSGENLPTVLREICADPQRRKISS